MGSSCHYNYFLAEKINLPLDIVKVVIKLEQVSLQSYFTSTQRDMFRLLLLNSNIKMGPIGFLTKG